MQSNKYERMKISNAMFCSNRSMTFAALMRQECSWYDDENHSSAALSARLTGDAGNLQGAIGYPLSIIFQSLSTLIIGLAVAFSYSIKLSLVCLATVPLSLLTVFLEAKHTSKSAIVEKESTEVGTKIATEAITNIRTVASLSKNEIELFGFE